MALDMTAFWAELSPALDRAQDDADRQAVIALILRAFTAPMESLLSQTLCRPIALRRVETCRLTRGVRQYGTCTLRRRDDGTCRLAISRNLFFPGNERNLVDVVCHEMLHACLPAREGHGPLFHEAMNALNRTYGLGIAIHSSENAIGQAAAFYRYKVTCGGCGHTFYYLRAGALVRHPRRYRCARCGKSRFAIEKLR